jgi:hypothetical protein
LNDSALFFQLLSGYYRYRHSLASVGNMAIVEATYRLLSIAALVLSFGISSAEAAKRVALVIGNNSYKRLQDLNNAR